MSDHDTIIETVCRDHGLTLVDAAVEGVSVLAERYDISEDWLVDHSYLIGGTEVVLGVYSSPDVRLAAFFHEVGHHLETTRTPVTVEAAAWERAWALATKHGIGWSSEVTEYIAQCLRSYEDGEDSPPKPKDREVLTKGRGAFWRWGRSVVAIFLHAIDEASFAEIVEGTGLTEMEAAEQLGYLRQTGAILPRIDGSGAIVGYVWVGGES